MCANIRISNFTFKFPTFLYLTQIKAKFISYNTHKSFKSLDYKYKKRKQQHQNKPQLKVIIFMINNINTSTARQESSEDTKQSRARYPFNFLPNTNTFLHFHLLQLYPPKTFLSLFQHFLFIISTKCVTSQIQLSTRDAIHHPRMLLLITLFST